MDQYSKWYDKLKLTQEFGPENKLNVIQKKVLFFKTLNLIYKKKYYESFKSIFFYPNNFDKLKLFIILVTPSYLLRRIINLR